jgi:hypothetical protein
VSHLQLSSGAFHTGFDDELAARAAARDARCVGFVVDVEDTKGSGWLTVSRRRHPFAPDDTERYAGRLRTIATAHGGSYQGYVEEAGL